MNMFFCDINRKEVSHVLFRCYENIKLYRGGRNDIFVGKEHHQFKKLLPVINETLGKNQQV
jgi:hypothetical protein